MRGKNAAAVRPGREILAIECGQSLGIPEKQFSKHFQIFRLAVFAEPLQFVLVAAWPESDQLSDAGIEPAERIWKRERMQRFEVVVFAERDQAGVAASSVIESEDQ